MATKRIGRNKDSQEIPQIIDTNSAKGRVEGKGGQDKRVLEGKGEVGINKNWEIREKDEDAGTGGYWGVRGWYRFWGGLLTGGTCGGFQGEPCEICGIRARSGRH